MMDLGVDDQALGLGQPRGKAGSGGEEAKVQVRQSEPRDGVETRAHRPAEDPDRGRDAVGEQCPLLPRSAL